MPFNYNDERLDDLDLTEYQREILNLIRREPNKRKVGDEMNTTYGAVKSALAKIRRKAARKLPDLHDTTVQDRVPEGYAIKGTSNMQRNAEGLPFWVKTNIDMIHQMEGARAVVNAFAASIEPVEPVEFTGQTVDSDEFCVVPLGDPHIGLMTWAKEVGHDWDLKIAHRVFNKVFARMFSRLPRTNEIILVNTGDFFHADNIHAESSRSGHKFDMDGRHGKWLEAGMIIMRMFIDYALNSYEKVTLVNVPGNHDDLLGLSIGISTDMYYENEPRVTVMRGENPFQYIERGQVLLGFAHGHTCKMPSLPGKMADDMYKAWGRTTYRHWITGHVHHRSWQQYKEHPGCSVESVGIIPPKDAYAHGGAFGARRGLQGVVYDPSIGEIMRIQEYIREED